MHVSKNMLRKAALERSKCSVPASEHGHKNAFMFKIYANGYTNLTHPVSYRTHHQTEILSLFAFAFGSKRYHEFR